MNVIELPIYEDQYYTYTTSLEGERYSFTFLWNERDRGWRVDIHKEDRTPVLLGYKLVSSYPMLADYSLNDLGLSGYLVLLPKAKEAGLLRTSASAKSQYYRLYYIYE